MQNNLHYMASYDRILTWSRPYEKRVLRKDNRRAYKAD